MNSKCDLDKFQLPRIPKKDWVKVLIYFIQVLKTNSLGEDFIDLLEGIMKYSPT